MSGWTLYLIAHLVMALMILFVFGHGMADRSAPPMPEGGWPVVFCLLVALAPLWIAVWVLGELAERAHARRRPS